MHSAISLGRSPFCPHFSRLHTFERASSRALAKPFIVSTHFLMKYLADNTTSEIKMDSGANLEPLYIVQIFDRSSETTLYSGSIVRPCIACAVLPPAHIHIIRGGEEEEQQQIYQCPTINYPFCLFCGDQD